MNQLTPRHSVDTIARLSHENMADMQIANGTANCRGAVRLYQERFLNRYLPGHRKFANLHHRLQGHESFNENRRGFRRPRELRDAFDEDVLSYYRDNPHASIRAAARDLIRNHVDVWHVLKDNHLNL